MDRLSDGDEMTPRNELRGLSDPPRLYHVWFSTRRRKRLLMGDIEIQARRLLKRIAADEAIDLRECEIIRAAGFGHREVAEDGEGVAWYIRKQKRRLTDYES